MHMHHLCSISKLVLVYVKFEYLTTYTPKIELGSPHIHRRYEDLLEDVDISQMKKVNKYTLLKILYIRFHPIIKVDKYNTIALQDIDLIEIMYRNGFFLSRYSKD